MATAKLEIVKVATPLLLRVCVASVVVPSRKATVPVGVPEAEVTVAVKVTGCPKTGVRVEAASAIAPVACVTVSEIAVEDARSLASPRYCTMTPEVPAGKEL